jgi:Zn-dependent protease
MAAARQGTFRLFHFAGVDVFLHWSWFVVAAYEISTRGRSYSSPVWNVAEYLILFGIVLLHEYGHALACRSVGGRAEQIVLWPLGGIAFVDPPPRPGAHLWSIAAGPLVNVVLLLVFQVLGATARSLDWAASSPDLVRLIEAVWWINTGLLVFNLLPVYPLDGGQILRSGLWFFLGPARSLLVASLLGFVGVAGLVVLAFWLRSLWGGVIAGFVLLNCWGGFKRARQMGKVAAAPRREGFACPSCLKAPPRGEFWVCARCRKPFDTFATRATCPHCGAAYQVTSCPECGQVRPMTEWNLARPEAPPASWRVGGS